MGDEAGCSNLGFAYANGRGVKQDYAKASEFYAKACDMGNGGGCYNLGNLYAQGRGVKEDANTAEKYLKKACDMEPELACERYKEFIQR
nr:tetratricopeptide repeat protein [uncultured Campylobacter sp.]